MGVIDPTGNDPIDDVNANISNIDTIRSEADTARANLKSAQEAAHQAQLAFNATEMPEDTRKLLGKADHVFTPKQQALMKAQGIGAEAVDSAVRLATAREAESCATIAAKTALSNLKATETYWPKATEILDKANVAPDSERASLARASLARTQVTVANTINELGQQAKGLKDVKPGRYRPIKAPPPTGGGGPGGSSRRNTITNEPETAVLVASAIVTTSFNMLNADSPAGVFNAAAEGAIDYMGGAVLGALLGPPGAIVGSQTSKIAKDPVGSVKSVVHCVFGGYCGDAPFEMWDAFQTAGNAVVGCVFGGNCGETAGAISEALLKPALTRESLERMMMEHRR